LRHQLENEKVPTHRKIEVFETADGARFDDKAKAIEHVAEQCREVIDASLAQLNGRLGRSEIYRIVMCLIPDATAAKELVDNLSSKFVQD
jgi:hypothetical protein